MTQTILSAIIIVAAVAYALWRTRKAMKNAGGRCYGCPIKDACEKKKDKKACNVTKKCR